MLNVEIPFDPGYTLGLSAQRKADRIRPRLPCSSAITRPAAESAMHTIAVIAPRLLLPCFLPMVLLVEDWRA